MKTNVALNANQGRRGTITLLLQHKFNAVHFPFNYIFFLLALHNP